MNLQDKVDKIPKIGPKKQKLMQSLGITTIQDLLHYYPRRYENRTEFKKISEIKDGEKVSVKAKIIRFDRKIFRYKKGSIINLYVQDDTGTCCINIYNNNYILPELENSRYIYFYGQASENYDILTFNSPEIEFDNIKSKIGIIYPVYPLTQGLSNNDFVNSVKFVLSNYDIKDMEYFDNSQIQKYKLMPEDEAIRNIHFPKNKAMLKASMYRCIFDEFYELNIFLNNYRQTNVLEKGIKFEIKDEVQNFIENLPFKLTPSQVKVVKEILKDMNRQNPMRRLIQGDVGSGKTIVAFISIFNCCKNSYQSAFMVPTEVLAIQHYQSAVEIFKNTGIKVQLLVGSTKDKKSIYEKIKNGEIDLIIGTQALIQEDVIFDRLGLVITDEQHRFGVNQRKKLEEKSDTNPDILVMSATPIPRTLSLVIHKDLDVSIISELPQNRKPVKSMAVMKRQEEKTFAFVGEEVDKKRQAYIVCPLVEENEKLDLISVDKLKQKLDIFYQGRYKIEILHGKMKSNEKKKILEEFQENKINILISTTVIEVGINVPNATVMVIYDAQRFGLSQLHQLRGRVGRGKYQSYCIFIYESKNEITKQRINTIVSTNDGFEIAKKDLELRGAGDIFGVKQHGLPEFRIADVLKNYDILEFAQKCALETINTLDKEQKQKIISDIYKKLNIS